MNFLTSNNMQPQPFLSQLKNNPDITHARIKQSEDPFWECYIQVVGFLNGKYFAILFKSHDGKKTTTISEQTEDIVGFKKYFSIFE